MISSTPIQISHASPSRWTGNEYASVCPFNSAQNNLLLIDVDHFQLYSRDEGSDAFVLNAELPIPANAEPRWSRRDPNLIYCVGANSLLTYDIARNHLDTVREFTEYATISGKGESDISTDGRHMVFAGDSHAVFLYDVISDQMLTRFELPPNSFDQLYITPDNEILVGFYAQGQGEHRGLWHYDFNGKPVRQLLNAMSHMDVCSYKGRSTVVATNSNEPNPDPAFPNGIIAIDVETGEQRDLLSLGWSPQGGPQSMAVDISCGDGDSALISTYGQDSGMPYANALVKVPLDGSEPLQICKTGSVPVSYNAQPKASLSRDGSLAVFSSNSGRTENPDYIDVFLVEIGGQAQPGTKEEAEIDYSKFLDYEFVMRPQSDGSVRIFQRLRRRG